MAFLEKLTEIAKNVSDKTVEIAKNVGDKTSDMLEIGKLTAQISTSNSAIEELKTRLGDHYWGLFSNGAVLDDDAVVLCNTIKEYAEEIENLKAQLEELKKGSSGNAVQVCSACGAENSDDAVFCKNCGTKLATEEEAPADEACACEECQCDAEEQPTEEEPQTKICANCGAENAAENNFCERCGAALRPLAQMGGIPIKNN